MLVLERFFVNGVKVMNVGCGGLWGNSNGYLREYICIGRRSGGTTDDATLATS